MTCETCGAPTGWVRGHDLDRANESKRHQMQENRNLRVRIAELERQQGVLVEALKTAISTLERDGDEWGICGYLREALAAVKPAAEHHLCIRETDTQIKEYRYIYPDGEVHHFSADGEFTHVSMMPAADQQKEGA